MISERKIQTFVFFVISNFIFATYGLDHDRYSRFVSKAEAARKADPAAASRADALEAAADAEFLSELSDNPRMLRGVRVKAENFDQAVSCRVLAESRSMQASYNEALESIDRHKHARVTKINQDLLAEIKYRESIERQLAAVTVELFVAKKRLSDTETALAELRARPVTPISATSQPTIGRPPIVPKSRAGSN